MDRRRQTEDDVEKWSGEDEGGQKTDRKRWIGDDRDGKMPMDRRRQRGKMTMDRRRQTEDDVYKIVRRR